jgi:integrase
MTGVPRLVALLLYGAGFRLLECLTLRVKDLDFRPPDLAGVFPAIDEIRMSRKIVA